MGEKCFTGSIGSFRLQGRIFRIKVFLNALRASGLILYCRWLDSALNLKHLMKKK